MRSLSARIASGVVILCGRAERAGLENERRYFSQIEDYVEVGVRIFMNGLKVYVSLVLHVWSSPFSVVASCCVMAMSVPRCGTGQS